MLFTFLACQTEWIPSFKFQYDNLFWLYPFHSFYDFLQYHYLHGAPHYVVTVCLFLILFFFVFVYVMVFNGTIPFILKLYMNYNYFQLLYMFAVHGEFVVFFVNGANKTQCKHSNILGIVNRENIIINKTKKNVNNLEFIIINLLTFISMW